MHLSKRQWRNAIAAVIMTMTMPVFAENPVFSVCNGLRDDMDYYYGLWEQGGSAKQMQVWQNKYRQALWKYGGSGCPRIESEGRKNIMNSSPQTGTRRGSGDVKTAPSRDEAPSADISPRTAGIG